MVVIYIIIIDPIVDARIQQCHETNGSSGLINEFKIRRTYCTMWEYVRTVHILRTVRIVRKSTVVQYKRKSTVQHE